VTIVSYLGFIAGPVYVGLWADALGLRTAMLAVAALGVALFALVPALLRLSGFDDRDDRRPRSRPNPAGSEGYLTGMPEPDQSRGAR
jgi:MFS family permease